MMECRIENNVLWVKGKLDSSSSADFEAAIARLTESMVDTPPRAILELSGIETLTSAPLRAMLTLAKRLHAAQGVVVVAAPSPIALEALKVSGFLRLQVFQVVDSLPQETAAPPVAATPPSPTPAPSPAEPDEPRPPPEEPPPSPAAQQEHPAADRAPGFLRSLLRLLSFWKH